MKRPEGSIIYKIYFFSRGFFLTFGFLLLGALFFVERFIYNFHTVTIDAEVRESIEMSLENMPYKMKNLLLANIVFGAIGILALTH